MEKGCQGRTQPDACGAAPRSLCSSRNVCSWCGGVGGRGGEDRGLPVRVQDAERILSLQGLAELGEMVPFSG